MSTKSFMLIDDVNTVPANELKVGQIALLSGWNYPILRTQMADLTPVFVDLGGDEFLNIWNADGNEQTAFPIPDWRLEVDPSSLTEEKFTSYVPGLAFRNNEFSGVFATREGQFSRCVVVPIGGGDVPMIISAQAPRLFFSDWRIVSGPLDDPQVWVVSRGKIEINAI